jgi:hypothetical protein
MCNIRGVRIRRARAIKPHKRAGIWNLVRRVLKEFARLDTRENVCLSADIAVVDDPKGLRAGQRIQILNVELEAAQRAWRGRLNRNRAPQARPF